jgi:hypothetical protein
MIPTELVDELGYWVSPTPMNGPYPRFHARRATEFAHWFVERGYTVRRLPDLNVTDPASTAETKVVAEPVAPPPPPEKLPRPRELDGLRPDFGYLTSPRPVPRAQSGTQFTVDRGITTSDAASEPEWLSTLEAAMSVLFGYILKNAVSTHLALGRWAVREPQHWTATAEREVTIVARPLTCAEPVRGAIRLLRSAGVRPRPRRSGQAPRAPSWRFRRPARGLRRQP